MDSLPATGPNTTTNPNQIPFDPSQQYLAGSNQGRVVLVPIPVPISQSHDVASSPPSPRAGAIVEAAKSGVQAAVRPIVHAAHVAQAGAETLAKPLTRAAHAAQTGVTNAAHAVADTGRELLGLKTGAAKEAEEKSKLGGTNDGQQIQTSENQTVGDISGRAVAHDLPPPTSAAAVVSQRLAELQQQQNANANQTNSTQTNNKTAGAPTDGAPANNKYTLQANDEGANIRGRQDAGRGSPSDFDHTWANDTGNYNAAVVPTAMSSRLAQHQANCLVEALGKDLLTKGHAHEGAAWILQARGLGSDAARRQTFVNDVHRLTEGWAEEFGYHNGRAPTRAEIERAAGQYASWLGDYLAGNAQRAAMAARGHVDLMQPMIAADKQTAVTALPTGPQFRAVVVDGPEADASVEEALAALKAKHLQRLEEAAQRSERSQSSLLRMLSGGHEQEHGQELEQHLPAELKDQAQALREYVTKLQMQRQLQQQHQQVVPTITGVTFLQPNGTTRPQAQVQAEAELAMRAAALAQQQSQMEKLRASGGGMDQNYAQQRMQQLHRQLQQLQQQQAQQQQQQQQQTVARGWRR